MPFAFKVIELLWLVATMDQNASTRVRPSTQSRKGLFCPTLVELSTIVYPMLIQLMLTSRQLVDPAEDDGQAGVHQPRLPST